MCQNRGSEMEHLGLIQGLSHLISLFIPCQRLLPPHEERAILQQEWILTCIYRSFVVQSLS